MTHIKILESLNSFLALVERQIGGPEIQFFDTALKSAPFVGIKQLLDSECLDFSTLESFSSVIVPYITQME